MAQNVLTAAQTSTQLSDTTQNPVRTANRAVVHCTLVFDGVTFTPADLLTALDTQFGTVSYEKDVVARGTYVFNISA